MNKKIILDHKKLKIKVDALRLKGKKIVFTNGCFDLLHLGHIRYLSKAKKLGDYLIVGLNSDGSVRAIKGSSRPLNKQASRLEVLASLEMVDFVTLFNDNTPERLILLLKPDVLVKGADWKIKDIVGSSFIKNYGGRVSRIPYLKGYSTTGLIKKIAKKR